MPADCGGCHIPVAEFQNIAYEHMVCVQGVIKTVGSAEEQIAAAAEKPVLHLLVQINDKAVSRGLDY